MTEETKNESPDEGRPKAAEPAADRPCMPAPIEDVEPAPEPAADTVDAGDNGAAQPAAAQPAAEEPSLEEKVALLEAEAEKARDQMLRALADAENTRRRAERAQQDTAKYAISDFARDLLSAADNLRRALDAVPDEGVSGEAVLKQLTEGVAATEQELLSCFEKFGVQRINALDQRFDPNVHQAMFEVPDTGKESGTVVQVIQEGYMIHDRLLRPALVGVAKAAPAQQVDTTA